MPYVNIVFAKLEKRLLNDPRWYMLTETAQLNYIKFILFAAETYNKIPKNEIAIKKAFKTNQDVLTISKTIEEIRANFKKFKANKYYYYFQDFQEKTNYIPIGKSKGNPEESQSELQIKRKIKIKNKKKSKSVFIPPTLEEVTSYCRERKNNVDPDRWFNFYQAKDWYIGRNKMINWQAAVRTWESKKEFTLGSGKRPVHIEVIELRAAKVKDDVIKEKLLLKGYTEREIDEGLGKKY